MSCPCAFAAAPLLPRVSRTRAPRAAPRAPHTRATPVCQAKRKNGRARAARRGDSDGAGGRGRDKDEEALLSEFVEEVARPLVAGKFEKPTTIGFETAEDRAFDWEKTFGQGRGLELLRRATWVGVYSLIALFFFIHLVWVGDWVGKAPPPTPH
jgi:hypothetical protein